MKKRPLALALALATAVSLTACGSSGGTSETGSGDSGSASGEPTKMTLILRGGAYGESLEASLPAFEEEHNVDMGRSHGRCSQPISSKWATTARGMEPTQSCWPPSAPQR